MTSLLSHYEPINRRMTHVGDDVYSREGYKPHGGKQITTYRRVSESAEIDRSLGFNVVKEGGGKAVWFGNVSIAEGDNKNWKSIGQMITQFSDILLGVIRREGEVVLYISPAKETLGSRQLIVEMGEMITRILQEDDIGVPKKSYHNEGYAFKAKLTPSHNGQVKLYYGDQEII